jgi:hypothetical protein
MRQSIFVIDYLCQYESISETTVAHDRLMRKKCKKSRDTASEKIELIFKS